MSETTTASATYTTVDVENVVRRVKADLIMMADSSGALTSDKARDYGHDIEVLAKNGYLRKVDLTLISGGNEIRAASYGVNTEAGGLSSSRSGGVLWPRIAGATFRIILFYTDAYTDDAKTSTSGKLKIAWSPTNADTSHSGLTSTGGRDYTSNSYGMQRKDWAA